MNIYIIFIVIGLGIIIRKLYKSKRKKRINTIELGNYIYEIINKPDESKLEQTKKSLGMEIRNQDMYYGLALIFCCCTREALSNNNVNSKIVSQTLAYLSDIITSDYIATFEVPKSEAPTFIDSFLCNQKQLSESLSNSSQASDTPAKARECIANKLMRIMLDRRNPDGVDENYLTSSSVEALSEVLNTISTSINIIVEAYIVDPVKYKGANYKYLSKEDIERF